MSISKNSNTNQDFIFETQYWKVVLSYKQCYLGRCVIFLKRNVEHLSELATDEFLDFQKVVQKLEKATKLAFGATMFNWSCLKNDGYKSKPHKPLMHWHFRPRYEKEFEFEGKTFKDIDFGSHYNSFKQEKEAPEIDFDQEFRRKIIQAIQKYL